MIYPDEVLVIFEKDATDADFQRFFKAFQVKSFERRQDVTSNGGKLELGGYNNSFVAAFDADKIPLTELPVMAEKAGMRGEYTFADRRAAVAVQQTLKAHDIAHKKAFKVAHVGINRPVAPTAITTNEGGGQSPSHSNFWFMRDYGSNGIYGNRINFDPGYGQIGHSWHYATGTGVKVAVIDQYFLWPGEAVNHTLFGNHPTVYTFNYDTLSADLSTSQPPVVNGVHQLHGRWVSSVIFLFG